MNKFAEKRKLASRRLFVTSCVAFSLLSGFGVADVNAAPAPQVVASSKATTTISGTVKDTNGNPIIGANVMERGTTRGIVTDLDGKFTLKVSPNSTIEFSYLGYATQSMSASDNMEVVLKEDNALLDEVVVVGYGQQKKVNLTGAVSVVDVDKAFESRPETDVAKALQGNVPGLTITNSDGSLGSTASLQIRGLGTLSNNETSSPLIVLDGVPIDDLSFVNPQDIASISVLKDAASTSIYGARAAFGVILITTKGGSKTDKIKVSYSNNFAWDTPTILPNYPDVPTQIRALSAANNRAGLENELFGMNLDTMLPYAEAWKKQHGGKKSGYREMVPYTSMDNVGDYFVNPDGSGAMYYADWDVVDIMFRDWTPSQTHNVNINGTSGKTTYYLSAGYTKKEGSMAFNPDKFKRLNVTANLTSNVTDWLQIGGRFNFSNKNFDYPVSRRSTSISSTHYNTTFQYMWRWGSFFGPYGTINGQDARNDIAYLKQAGDGSNDETYMRIGAFIKANITHDITINADYTFDLTNGREKKVYLPFTAYNTWGGNISAPSNIITSTGLYQESLRDSRHTINVYGNYNHSWGKHELNVMAGGTLDGTDVNNFGAIKMDLHNVDYPEFSLMGIENQTIEGLHTHAATAGYFGRINYNYNNIWLLEFNGRYDGSSSFPASDRWAFFPSGSLGYRFSEENFFEPIKDIVNNGKFRASYGEIGNEAVGENMFRTMMESGSVNWLNASGLKLQYYGTPRLVSPTLTWERIQTLDLGIDLGFLSNELTLGFDWYQRYTRDMLAPGKTYPDVLGTESPYTNAGSLRTRGWELNLNWNHRFGEFDVYANFNIGDFKTVITEWSDDSRLLNTNYSGKTYGDIWGFETDRLFTEADFVTTTGKDGKPVTTYANGVASQKGLEQDNFVYGPGDIKFKDLNGDGVIDGGKGTADDHGDLKVIGNSTPRYQYSFRVGGAWKGIDLDVYFQGVGKCDQWTQSSFVMPMMRGADAIYENQTDYWTEENQNYSAFYPRMYPGNAAQGTVSGVGLGNHNFYPQSRYLVDMSYLRLKNITLGYTLPQNLTKKWYMEKVRVYFSASNICELINNSIAPIDPELQGSESSRYNKRNSSSSNDFGNGTWGRIEPLSRTVSFGLQVTF